MRDHGDIKASISLGLIKPIIGVPGLDTFAFQMIADQRLGHNIGTIGTTLELLAAPCVEPVLAQDSSKLQFANLALGATVNSHLRFPGRWLVRCCRRTTASLLSYTAQQR